MHITPTVGRVMWFWPALNAQAHIARGEQPLAATVAYVHGDGALVNLTVSDSYGGVHAVTSVPVVQEGEPRPTNGGFAEWIPYQVGQARSAAANAEAKKD